MPFDAKHLCWPPLHTLFYRLEAIKLEPGAVVVPSLRAALAEYEPWLAKGLQVFQTPSAASKKALETATQVLIAGGDEALHVDSTLRVAAIEASSALNLDEVQTYFLLHRWCPPPPFNGTAGKQPSLAGGRLSAEQLQSVALLYAQERLCLLQSLEGLLWLGERELGHGAAQLKEVIEATLSSLLAASPGLEEVTFLSLKKNVEGDGASPGATVPALAAAAGTPVASEEAAAERNVLITILALLYFHPRQPCTPQRFVELARLFRGGLFAADIRSVPVNGHDSGPTASQLSVKLASLLLLEVLMDVEKLLKALANGAPITAEASPFLVPGVLASVDSELRSWWPIGARAHAPLLLAWASLLCLAGKATEAEGHAARAHQCDALGTLCTLSSPLGIRAEGAETSGAAVASTVAAVLAAFGLDPGALPVAHTEQLVQILVNYFADQPGRCESFWAAPDALLNQPVLHFLDGLAGLFPGLPVPLLSLLTALATDPAAAAEANSYLAHQVALTSLHQLPDAAIAEDARVAGQVLTQQELALPGSTAVTLGTGIAGEVVHLPEGSVGSEGPRVWACSPEADPDSLLLVRWRLPLAQGDAQWLLLCRAFEALAAAQRSGSGGARGRAGAAAVRELETTLGFFAAVCRNDPAAGKDLLREVVGPEPDAMDSDIPSTKGPDLLVLVIQSVSALAELRPLPAVALAHSFAICAGLAPSVPGRALTDLLNALGVSTLDVMMATAPPTGGAGAALPDVPVLRRLLAAEQARGQYPATQALLQLVVALLQAGCPAPELSVVVSFVLQRVMPELPQCRFANRAQRWHLATTCLNMMRQALLAAPTGTNAAGRAGDTEEGSKVGQAVAAVLRFDSGAAACLFRLLPPDAATLEAMSRHPRSGAEVQAAQECCVAWLRLLPVLLPPANPSAMLAPAGFLREPSPPGAGRSPSAILLSYLCYPFFDRRERALVVRAVHCLAAAATAVAPDAPLAALLPQDSGAASGASPAARAVLAQAISSSAAGVSRDLFSATCDLLSEAVQHHPSLLDVLMFPSALESSGSGKENRDGNAAASGPGGNSKALVLAQAKREGAAPQRSCLDALWSLVQDSDRLLREQPHMLAKTLQVLAALWQSGGVAFRPLAILQQQPELWEHIISVVKAGAETGPLQLPDPSAVGAAAGWAAQDSACWLIIAESAALQIMAAECYMAAAAASAGKAAEASAGGMLPALAAFLRQDAARCCPRLLKRYCQPLPTSRLLEELRRQASATGARLLSAELSDEVLWPSMAAGASVISALAVAAQPLALPHGDRAEAARKLTAVSAGLAGGEGLWQHPGAAALGGVLLEQAEVPARIAADREPGGSFVYDAQVFKRRVGAVSMRHASALQELCGWLEAAGVAASLEDARLAAGSALRALQSVAREWGQTPAAAAAASGDAGGAVTLEEAEACVDVLAGAIQSVVGEVWQQAAEGVAGAAAAPPIAVDAFTVHVASAAEAVRVVLIQLQRWTQTAGVEQAGVASLCKQLLELAGTWLAAAGSIPEPAPAVSATTQCLLSAALLLVAAAPQQGVEPLSEDSQGLQGAAAQLLPALLSLLLHPGGEHAVAAASLVTALIERTLPQSAWLPLLQAHFHLGNAISVMLRAMSARRQQHGAAAAGGDADTPGTCTGGGPLEAASSEEAALLLALQVAQTPAGAALLVEQGAPSLILALSGWLQSPPPGGDLLGDTSCPPPLSAAAPPVDYGNAYLQGGAPNPAHRLWCSALAVAGLLLAALPGHPAVEDAALQLAVGMDPRLLLAVEPPEGSPQQPLTLAIAQEAKYVLFLLCGLTPLAGQWRLALPQSLPALRRATASLLVFLAQPSAAVHCAPVAPAEKAAAKGGAGVALGGGWFGTCAGSTTTAAAGTSRVGSYSWQLAERLCSCMQYALAFQLATAPEVSEGEAGGLGPEWVTPATLRRLQTSCVEVAAAGCAAEAAADAAVRRVLRSVAATLRATLQLQELLSARLDRQAERETRAALQKIEGVLAAGQQ